MRYSAGLGWRANEPSTAAVVRVSRPERSLLRDGPPAMNTYPDDSDAVRAAELAFEARRGPLGPSDQTWLDELLDRRPALRTELASLESFLLRVKVATDIDPSPAFASRVAARLDALRTREVVTPAASLRSVFARLRDLVWGSPDPTPRPRVSLGTLLVGRALAVYCGAAVVACWFFLSSPTRPSSEHAVVRVASAPASVAPALPPSGR